MIKNHTARFADAGGAILQHKYEKKYDVEYGRLLHNIDIHDPPSSKSYKRFFENSTNKSLVRLNNDGFGIVVKTILFISGIFVTIRFVNTSGPPDPSTVMSRSTAAVEQQQYYSNSGITSNEGDTSTPLNYSLQGNPIFGNSDFIKQHNTIEQEEQDQTHQTAMTSVEGPQPILSQQPGTEVSSSSDTNVMVTSQKEQQEEISQQKNQEQQQSAIEKSVLMAGEKILEVSPFSEETETKEPPSNSEKNENPNKSTPEFENLPLEDLSNFKNSWEPFDKADVPVFLHIPKAGGSTIKDIIGTCHRFVMATESGVTDGHENDTEISVVYPAGEIEGQDRSPFVNVDTTTVAGINRAKNMGFADSGLANAVVTPFIYEANELFTPTAQGRLFTVFRHPIDRAISLFYYIQVADWEPTYSPELKDWTIEEYARSDRIENNWLTRQLANKPEGDLDDKDVKIAMEVVRRKVLVGLMTEIERTMDRFEKFFRWTFHVNPTNQDKCREALLSRGSNTNSKKNKNKPEEGSEAWELLMWQNQYDMQLYQYIEVLFEEQDVFVTGLPDNYRNVDSTCCKCSPATFPPEGFICPLAVVN